VSTAVAQGLPWGPAAVNASTTGFNAAIFGYTGCGKTTLAMTAQDHPLGKNVFFWAIDSGIRSLAHRTDIQTWPRAEDGVPTWDKFVNVNAKLNQHAQKTGGFQTYVLDDLTKLYRLALDKALGGTTRQPEWGDWRKANELCIEFMEEWCDRSRAKGINFIVNAHAKDVIEGTDESTGVLHIRIKATPGLSEEIPRLVDTIGYLEEKPPNAGRKESVYTLYLHRTGKFIAKYRQPIKDSGAPQLPLELVSPKMGTILDHIDELNKFRNEKLKVEGLVGPLEKAGVS